MHVAEYKIERIFQKYYLFCRMLYLFKHKPSTNYPQLDGSFF